MMKIFGQENDFSLYPIDNSINMSPFGAAFPNMSPLGVASPIKGFNSVEKHDLEEVTYKQGYTNEE